MRRPWLPLALALLTLPGCASAPTAQLVARASVPPPAAPAAAVVSAEEGLEAEPDEREAPEVAEALPSVASPQPEAPGLRRTLAYALSIRADASGQALEAAAAYRDPVYLAPRYYPVILPGTPSSLPAFTPRPVDVSRLPTDAVAELGRLGRLRDRKRGLFSWLVGYSFPKLTAAAARVRLAAGEPVWLAPSGSHWHRDRAYTEVRDVRVFEAMLEELRRAVLDVAARQAREANIEARMALTPPFNGTFDVYKLWLAEQVVDGFTYGGQPVRRGVVTAAGLFEQRAVRRRIATYWEDHPGCTASELRHVATTVLIERLDDLRRSASTYAANPGVYADAQLIPGLRDPRPVVNGDRTWYDVDVRYNEDAIRAMGATMPQVLRGAIYP
ncbi:MAG: hypothetical protein VKQ33_05355 [Candidatus Sericytochromatia bacterium]|nr:hypothetical protein [Candidatus Sericytochromatia bacterium]